MTTKMAPKGRAPVARKFGAAAAAVGLMTLAGIAGAATSVDSLKASTALTTPIVQAAALPASFSEVIARVGPAVVSVEVERGGVEAVAMQGDLDGMPPHMRRFFERFFDDNDRSAPGTRQKRLAPRTPRSPNVTGVGSGFIIDRDGLIVTNHHVIKDAEKITVTLQTGKRYDAELVGRDPKTDLALLKIDGADKLPAVAFAGADAKVGDWVIAIGNPFGLGHTATTGIVSARHRNIGAGPYDDFLQIDAPINRGNSGGPVFNVNGNVVGINTAIFSPNGGNVGIGFAIPASLAGDVVADLKDDGKVDRGWLGVQIQPVGQDIADSVGLDHAMGAIVVSVLPDSPAAAADLKQGDVIVAVNGTAIATMRQLPRLIAGIAAGEEAELTVWRDGAKRTVSVKIGALQENAEVAAKSDTAAETDVLGMELAELSTEIRGTYRIGSEVEGVVVTGVKPGAAAAKGIAVGDVIAAIAGAAVTTPENVAAAVATAEQEKRKALLFLIKRQNTTRFVALPLRKA